MSAQPLGNPIFQAFDSNGAPLSGGLLYSFFGGTASPQATYTDQSGTVANANPVVLDANGRASVWMAPGTLYKFVLQNASAVQQWSVDNFPSPAAAATGSTAASANDPGGRISLTNTAAVPTSDLTSQGTVYYMDYKSDEVPLYNGSSWSLYSTSGGAMSQALSDTIKSPGAAAANSCYDLFIWLDGSTMRLSRGPAWTSDTARGSGAGTSQLQQVSGRWMNAQNITNGPNSWRGLYVGTIRTDGSAQGNDSLAKRHCWNAYNRVLRPMSVPSGSAGWTYATSTIRQANANAANQLDYVVGLSEDEVTAQTAICMTGSGGGASGSSGIGVDSTTAFSSAIALGTVPATTTSLTLTALYRGLPGIGRHYLAWLEYTSSGTVSWVASGGFPGVGGIMGDVRG